MSKYFTIQSNTEGLYKEKGSKFFSFAFSVETQEDIKSCLAELRKQFHDARHHCYAWKTGLAQPSTRANDDGEPSHSAGDPILGQINSFNLTNVLVVVIRYFGGTKLGVGGLIHAYKVASEEALKVAIRKQIFEVENLEISFSYPAMSSVERLISEFEIDVTTRDFQEECLIRGKIKKDFLDEFKVRTKDLYELNILINGNEPIK